MLGPQLGLQRDRSYGTPPWAVCEACCDFKARNPFSMVIWGDFKNIQMLEPFLII